MICNSESCDICKYYPDACKLLTENPPIDTCNISDQIEHLLDDIQGNTLKSHGRVFSVFLFLQFDTSDPSETEYSRKIKEIKTWISSLAEQVVSALKQQSQAARYQSTSYSEPFLTFSLSFKGYEALKLFGPDNKENLFKRLFLDDPFEKGMKFSGKTAKLTKLGDNLNTWEQEYKENLHAVVLLADSNHEQLYQRVKKLSEEVKDKPIKIVKIEAGCVRKNGDEQSVEPFGFPDNISQPLFFLKDINKVQRNNWDPCAKLGLVLTVDPFGSKFSQNSYHYSYGSFLVFRKLEQNVEGFNQKITEIAQQLSYEGDTRSSAEEREDLARAFVVGRYRKGGYPVYSKDLKELNDFNYGIGKEFESDSALKCPFNAHIRRMNPRGVKGQDQSGYVHSGKSYNKSPEEQRNARIVRRGLPYGLPKDTSYLSELTQKNLENYKDLIKELSVLKEDLKITLEDNEGILFCCFQSRIENQFYLLQVNYGNDPDLGPNKEGNFGLDSLIGQPREREDTKPIQGWWPKEWGNADGKLKFEDLEAARFSHYVIPRGGEYFFTPSISFLKSLKEG